MKNNLSNHVLKASAIILPVLLCLYFLCVTLFTASPMRLLDNNGKWFHPACDISVGLAECECLRKGVDPYDIFSGTAVLEGYRPGGMAPPSGRVFSDNDAPVNVHPPWFYTAILPFTFMPHRTAAAVHFTIMVVCLAVLWAVGYGMAKKQLLPKDRCISIASFAVLMISLPAFQDFHSQNWAVMMLAAAMAMAICLNRGHDILAGLCWSLIMVKPQVGLIFAIPVLMGRKFVTLFVAIAACLLASAVPAALCGSSVLKMILVTPSANYTQFWGCGTAPKFLADLLPQSAAIYLGLALGAVLCILMTKKMMERKDYFHVLMPAATCSSLWTYSRCYGHVTAWFFIIVLLLEMAKRPRSKFLWAVFACSVLLFSRITNFIHILAQMFSSLPIPSIVLSDDFHFHTDSVVSSLSLLLVMVFCFSRSTKTETEAVPEIRD